MAYDPNIILSGLPVDVVGSMGRGNALAQMQLQAQDQNALRGLYQSQGPQILAGDPNAINALARLDPNAAIGVRQSAQEMQAGQQEMQAAAEEHARSVDAQTLATQAAELESDLKGAAYFHAKGDKAGYDAFIRSKGMDPAQYSFDSFPAIAAQIGGVLEVWNGFAPKQQSSSDRFKVVGSQIVDLNAEGGPKPVYAAPQSESGTVVYDPQTGNPIVTTGSAKPVKPFTEAQSKDVVFATRAKGALAALDPVADSLTSRMDAVAGAVPYGIARGMQSDNYQLAEQAGLEFLQAILRKDTGAAITQSETDSYGKVYLPQPGDSQARLTAKKEARARSVAALEAGMSSAQILATEVANMHGNLGSEGGASSGNATKAPPGFEDIWGKY